MNKLKCYEYLSKINTMGVDISEQLSTVVRSKDVPMSVVSFINKYYPQELIKTFDNIHEKRHTNPLYKNLVNEKLSVEQKAIAISSLVTRVMITLSNIENEDIRREYSKDMNLKEMIDSLTDYAYNGNTDKLINICNKQRNLIKEIY